MGSSDDSDFEEWGHRPLNNRRKVAPGGASRKGIIRDQDDDESMVFVASDNDSDFHLSDDELISTGKKGKGKATSSVIKKTTKKPTEKPAKTSRAPKKANGKATKPLSETSINRLNDTTEPSSVLLSPSTPNKENNSMISSRPGSSSKKKDASSQYQKLTQLEHILKRPDTYIGSVERTEMKMWVFDSNTKSMDYRDVTIVPGLYKIFDEILVNAADNKIRDPSMNTLEVNINVEENKISVYNNGKGIPIEIHKKEKIYIPELIFGNLLTSSNYDDNEKKVTGGRNGYGAKVCNIE